MADIRNPKLLYLKGGLFVVLGCIAAAGILIEHPEWRIGLLLAIAVWAFARAYYFAFYVVQHYIDGEFRFAGLWSFFRYVMSRPRQPPGDARPPDRP